MLPLDESDPKAIGPYRIVGLLGSGGMGRVYLGHSRSGRQVAIKVIRSDFAADPIFRERFAREVAAARSVSPLFTAAVIDADPQARPPWLATTFIDGVSLDERIAAGGPMAPEEVFAMAAGLAEALSSIHRAGLVHRDLKPGNILLNSNGPHVIDFGLALDPNATRMTSGIIVGTPSYMAPERLAGEEAGPPSDIFSLAATLYYAATGKELVDDASIYEQILQIKQGRFDLDALPARLRPLIVRCISHEPRQRPTADELSRIIAAMDVGLPSVTVSLPYPGRHRAAGPTGPLPTTPPPAAKRRWSRRAVLGLSGGVGVAVVAGGAFTAIELVGRKSTAQGAGGPPGSPPPIEAGRLVGQLDSGAAPPFGGPGRSVSTQRIIVDAQGRIITSDGQQVYAKDRHNHLLWVNPIPGSIAGTWLWGDAVLVTNQRQLWLFDAATGAQRFVTDPVTAESAVVAAGPSTGIPVVIGQIVVTTDRAIVALGTATVAIGPDGNKQWRIPVDPTSGTRRAATPAAADDKLLICQDTVTAPGGTGQLAVVSAYDPATGAPKWTVDYPLAPSQPPPGPGGPPGDPGGGRGGPPPDNWRRSEACITDIAIAVRDGSDLKVLSPVDGRRLWTLPSPLPINQITVAGDTLLVAADHLAAYYLLTGGIAWQNSLRGAHLAISTIPGCIVAVDEQFALGIDPGGRTLWQTKMPAPPGNPPVDAVRLNPHVAYVTFDAPDDDDAARQSPATGPAFDIVAIALDTAG